MRLRSKLILWILLILLLQAGISAFYTISTFMDHAELASREELQEGWRRARYSLERLRHRLYRDATHFRTIAEVDHNIPLDTEALKTQLHRYIGTSDADRIMLVDREHQILQDMHRGIHPGSAFSLDHISLDQFRFPKSTYIAVTDQRDPQLFLVTGTPVYPREGKLWLLMVNRIDRSFVRTIFDETGTRVAFFVGDHLMASDLPRRGGLVPTQLTSQEVEIEDIPFTTLSRPLSADAAGLLYMVAFKSDLTDQLYIRRVFTTFITAFLFTLGVSVLLAAGMTAYAVRPFSRLYRWLQHYQQHGKVTELDISGTDEIGFLARTFYDMVRKLIGDKQIIREQLSEISFLHQYNDAIVSNLQAGLLVVNEAGIIEYSNHYLLDLLDREESLTLGKDASSFILDSFSSQSLSRSGGIQFNEPWFIENLEFRSDHAETRRFVAKMVPLRAPREEQKYLVVFEDITRTDQLWQNVLVAEKITSLGMLSAGMAHEINNPLGSILSHVNYLKQIEDDPEKQESLYWVEQESNRIAAIIHRILSYARSESKSSRTYRLHELIDQTLQLISFELNKREITVTADYRFRGGSISMDPDELKQVILNILINAYQAAGRQGQITVTTDREAGDAVCIISDDGPGMDAGQLEYIFDPFYTTKHRSAHSTGLGLTISYSIVRRAGGDIRITSAPGEGTTVKITLPCGEEL